MENVINKLTKLALAGEVGSTLVFGITGCSISDCGTSSCSKEKAGYKGGSKYKSDAKCNGEGKCKANGKCKSEAK